MLEATRQEDDIHAAWYERIRLTRPGQLQPPPPPSRSHGGEDGTTNTGERAFCRFRDSPAGVTPSFERAGGKSEAHGPWTPLAHGAMEEGATGQGLYRNVRSHRLERANALTQRPLPLFPFLAWLISDAPGRAGTWVSHGPLDEPPSDALLPSSPSMRVLPVAGAAGEAAAQADSPLRARQVSFREPSESSPLKSAASAVLSPDPAGAGGGLPGRSTALVSAGSRASMRRGKAAPLTLAEYRSAMEPRLVPLHVPVPILHPSVADRTSAVLESLLATAVEAIPEGTGTHWRERQRDRDTGRQ